MKATVTLSYHLELMINEPRDTKLKPSRLGVTLGGFLMGLSACGTSPSEIELSEESAAVVTREESVNINFSAFNFHPVINLPAEYTVNDFTKGYDENRERKHEFDIGRYNEKRPGMYSTEVFQNIRDIHMGIDIGGPVGTPVHSFWEGTVYSFGYNSAEGDYGHTVIIKHVLDGVELYALHGHLSAASIAGKVYDQPIQAGEILGWIGDRHENGGWNPHLHFQLSLLPPGEESLPGATEPYLIVSKEQALRGERSFDIPGVVSDTDHESALRIYLDPRLVMGPIY